MQTACAAAGLIVLECGVAAHWVCAQLAQHTVTACRACVGLKTPTLVTNCYIMSCVCVMTCMLHCVVQVSAWHMGWCSSSTAALTEPLFLLTGVLLATA